jgi:hypothetical protein
MCHETAVGLFNKPQQLQRWMKWTNRRREKLKKIGVGGIGGEEEGARI